MRSKLLALLLILGVLLSFVACTPEDIEPHDCVDLDRDALCDVCFEGMPVPPTPDEPDGPGPDEDPELPDAPPIPDDEDQTGGNVNGDGSFDLPIDEF